LAYIDAAAAAATGVDVTTAGTRPVSPRGYSASECQQFSLATVWLAKPCETACPDINQTTINITIIE